MPGPAATTGLAASAGSAYDSTTAPIASSLDPQVVGQLMVRLDKEIKAGKASVDLDGLMEYQRVANYLSAAQIFLRSNALLTRPLEQGDIKKRLLGHWGSCPGINFMYAHTNYLITKHDGDEGGCPEFVFVTGPGHAAPALLACLYLEGSITRFYPEYPMSRAGVEKFVRAFSFPEGWPSHVNAETPGSIHEGGELGYSLAVAYGAVMDSPNLIAACVVGDGESETGPLSAAWQSHKYLDPAESGAVLPMLHVNGFKIGERTIPGTMDDLELTCQYTGMGYQVRIVKYGYAHSSEKVPESDTDHDVLINYDMAASMEWAYAEIRKIQRAARTGKPIEKPRWPLLIIRTPKGWTGPKKLNGNPIEGSWRAHQVPLPAAAKDPEQFKLLGEWLEEYKPAELFNLDVKSTDAVANDASNKSAGLISEVALRIIPSNVERRMGMIPASYKGYTPLDLPKWTEYGVEANTEVSAMKAVGSYVAEVVKRNMHSFRIFSPDEITSNKLDESLKVTHRNFQWDPETAHDGGRVTEMLSEHTLQGWLQGYTLTGRTGLFPSYESFLGIVTTMIEQYAKFLKMAVETKWRGPVASLNYIETSTLWRQEHNGYSHQNPGLIGSLLGLPRHCCRVYLPAEANSAVSVMAHCLKSKNYVNLIVGSKNPTRAWLSVEEAEKHCVAGASVWTKYSTDGGRDPDVVLVGLGVEVTMEVIAAAALLRNEGVRVRVVNVVDMMILGEEGQHPHALTEEAFISLFTKDRPLIFNFHGYPKDLAALLCMRKTHVSRSRMDICGYIEQGTTTTPYSMLRLNKASRYDLAAIAVGRIAKNQPNHAIVPSAHMLSSNWQHELRKHEQYTVETGEDPDWCNEIPKIKTE